MKLFQQTWFLFTYLVQASRNSKMCHWIFFLWKRSITERFLEQAKVCLPSVLLPSSQKIHAFNSCIGTSGHYYRIARRKQQLTSKKLSIFIRLLIFKIRDTRNKVAHLRRMKEFFTWTAQAPDRVTDKRITMIFDKFCRGLKFSIGKREFLKLSP